MIDPALEQVGEGAPGDDSAQNDHAQDQPPVAYGEEAAQAVGPLPGSDAVDDFSGCSVKDVSALDKSESCT